MRFRPWAAEKKQEIRRLTEELALWQKHQLGVRTIEKRVDVPVEKIVEKPVERQVDNPAHLARIKVLESEVAVIGGLREQIAKLEARPPKIVEKRVDVPVEKIVEKIVYRDKPGRSKTLETTPSDDGRKASRRSPDDLKNIFGVGPVLEKLLNEQGVFCFDQIAKWTKADIEKFERQLPNFAGRITRENWVRSAIEEHYKKYKKWLGEGSPTVSIPETR
jgi:predicted flap endonuclease-1-like 5' DNA nuclease